MADCPKCWDALCGCGYEYLMWTPERLEEQARLLRTVAEFRREERYDANAIWQNYKERDAVWERFRAFKRGLE